MWLHRTLLSKECALNNKQCRHRSDWSGRPWSDQSFRKVCFGSKLLRPVCSNIWAASWQNQQNGMCAQSDQSLRCPHPWVLSYPFSAQRRPCGSPGWSESSLGAQSFCWFCHEAAHLGSLQYYHNWSYKYGCEINWNKRLAPFYMMSHQLN